MGIANDTDDLTVSSNGDARSVDNMLAAEFLSLSFQDRNAINEEIHGVVNLMPEETPELVSKSLRELEHELSLIPPERKEKYELVRQRYGTKDSSQVGGTYVNDVDFRLRFLRTRLFDAKKSASKLVAFLDMVCYLFGEYALQRPIRLSDFSESEMQVVRTGNLQLLPFRDRSGRRIITGVEGLAIQFDQKIRFKILYYLMWVAGQDVETQSKGIVVIIWPVPEIALRHFKNDLRNKERTIEDQTMLYEGASIRVVVYHFCVPDNFLMNVFRKIFAITVGKDQRSRIKFHSGHDTQLKYLLKGYGIPIDLIPLTATGNVKTQNLRTWLKLRNTIEKAEDDSIIECPGSNDVLFRPSKLIKGHPGNVKFHNLIESYHEKGVRTTAASKQITDDILKDNGFILVWDKRGWWTKETDDSQMRFKVSVSYRDFKKKNRAQTQVSNSSTFVFQAQDGNKRRRVEKSEPDNPGSMAAPYVMRADLCNFLNAGSGSNSIY